MAKKFLLNTVREGTRLKFHGMPDGVVFETHSPVSETKESTNIVSLRVFVEHSDGHESFHTYRHDGRSNHCYMYDITEVENNG